MVTVVGSLNIDYIASVQRLPSAGETVPAIAFIRRFGGKGANQALAAARQGAVVNMIGCVGDDADGRAYRQQLECLRCRFGGQWSDQNPAHFRVLERLHSAFGFGYLVYSKYDPGK